MIAMTTGRANHNDILARMTAVDIVDFLSMHVSLWAIARAETPLLSKRLQLARMACSLVRPVPIHVTVGIRR